MTFVLLFGGDGLSEKLGRRAKMLLPSPIGCSILTPLITGDMNMTDESELWYFMTQQRLAKLGLDVGVPYAGEGRVDEESMFTFSCAERYKHDIVQFMHEAATRDELTDDVIGAFESAWAVWPEDLDAFEQEMIRLRDIADEADANLPMFNR